MVNTRPRFSLGKMILMALYQGIKLVGGCQPNDYVAVLLCALSYFLLNKFSGKWGLMWHFHFVCIVLSDSEISMIFEFTYVYSRQQSFCRIELH
jgi:hypothetical protein